MRRGAAQRRSLPVVREPEPAETQRPPEPQAAPEQAEGSPEPEQPKAVYRVAAGRALCGGPRGMLQEGDRVGVKDCGGCPRRLQGLCKGGYLVRGEAPE